MILYLFGTWITSAKAQCLGSKYDWVEKYPSHAPLASALLIERPDGSVATLRGDPIVPSDLFSRLGDDELGREYRRRRRTDKLVWGTTIGVGGVVLTIGEFATFTGLLIALVDDDPRALYAGMALSGLGLGGVGTGITGAIVASKRHNSPSFWYPEATLCDKLDSYNRDLVREPAAIPQAQPIEVRVIAGVSGVTLKIEF